MAKSDRLLVLPEDEKNTIYGENVLTFPSQNNPMCGQVVAAWYNEIVHYDWKRNGFTEQAKHFTALIWKATRQVGCAKARAIQSGRYYVVVRTHKKFIR